MYRFLAVAGCIVSIGLAHGLQSPFKPGKLSKEEQAALQPGLTLRLARQRPERPEDARRVRLAALQVPAGAPVSPFLAPGPFVATLSGYVKSPLRSEYSFKLPTTGAATLHINGKEVLAVAAAASATATSEVVELAKGYNRLELRFTSHAQGDASLRLYWSGEGFGWEPVPPESLFTRGDEADLVAGRRVRQGRLLYATLGCARCHALPSTVKETPAMPEMQHQAPSLADAGARLRAEWLAQWIAQPRALRREALMPQLLHGAEAGQQAADIAAYLSSLRTTALPATTGAAEQGQKHFRKLGCIACHHFQAAEDDELKRLSLHMAAAKFQPGALESFLLQPHQHYSWIRMPDFKLSVKEASDLAAYIQGEAKGELKASTQAGKAERGGRLFQEAGCAHCHRTEPKAQTPPPRLAAIEGTKLGSGCTASARHDRAPDFGLSDEQRQSLAAFLATDGSSLLRETPAEFSRRQMESLQCTSCHRRDGGTTRWHQVLEEEGLTPEALPSLSWAGEKLQHEWAVRLLAGQSDQRARPWLKSRMPAFPARARMLAQGLAHEHGYSIAPEPPLKIDPQLAAIGASLIPQKGGFNCIMCHGVGKKPALEPFEAPGINLIDAALRLRVDYYRRWMLNPTRVDVVTRMPVFAQDGKTTALRDVFDGDAHRQFEAIWHYMQSLR